MATPTNDSDVATKGYVDTNTGNNIGAYYQVSITYNDGLDDIAAIDSAFSIHNVIRVGNSLSDTIDISRPIEIPRSGTTLIIDGYVRVMAGDSVTLTSDLVEGDTIVNVTSTDNFFPGQWVSVSDNSLPVQAGGTQTRLVSQGLKIKSILNPTSFSTTFPATHFNFVTEPDVDRVTVANDGYVGQQNAGVVATGLNNVKIIGSGTIDVNWQNSIDTEPISDPPETTWGEETRMTSNITFLNCRNVYVGPLTLINAGLHGVSFRATDNAVVFKTKIIDTHDKAILGFSGQDILVQDVYIDSSLFEDGLAFYSPGKLIRVYGATIKGCNRHAVLGNDTDTTSIMSLNDIFIDGYGTSGITIEGNSYDLNGIRIKPRNGSSTALNILGARRVNVNKITIDGQVDHPNIGINITTGNDGDLPKDVNISNLTLLGNGSGKAIRVVDNIDNIHFSNGIVDNWGTGHELTGTNGENIKFSNISFDRIQSFNYYYTNAHYTSVTGLTSTNFDPINTNSNSLLFQRLSGNDLLFTGLRNFPRNYSQYLFSSNQSLFSVGNNTLEVDGGLSISHFGASADFSLNTAGIVLGGIDALPASVSAGSPHFIGSNKTLAGYSPTKGWLIIGSNADSDFKSGIGFHVGGRTNPSMILSGAAQALQVADGTPDGVDLRTATSVPGAFYFAHNSSPNLIVDAFNDDSPTFMGRKSRGTGALPLPSEFGDRLLRLIGIPNRSDSTFVGGIETGGAEIRIVADQTATLTGQGAGIEFFTTPINSTTRFLSGKLPASGGLNIGDGVFTSSQGVINAETGFRLNDLAPIGEFLRGNGTNFVSSAIQGSDLPAPLTGTGVPGSTPSYTGQFYIDTSGGSGSQVIYMAAGTSSSSDWIQISN